MSVGVLYFMFENLGLHVSFMVVSFLFFSGWCYLCLVECSVGPFYDFLLLPTAAFAGLILVLALSLQALGSLRCLHNLIFFLPRTHNADDGMFNPCSGS